MAGWIIFLSIPVIFGGIGAFLRLLFRKPHPMIGKRNEITALYDKDGNSFSIEDFLGNVIVLQAWSGINELEGACRRLKRLSKFADQNQIVLKYYLVYVGADNLNGIPKANALLAKYSVPILLDKYEVFPRFFGKEYKLGGLIIDGKGMVRSVPRDRLAGSDRKILGKIFEGMRIG